MKRIVCHVIHEPAKKCAWNLWKLKADSNQIGKSLDILVGGGRATLKGSLKFQVDIDWTVSDGIWYYLSLWGLWFVIGHVQFSLRINSIIFRFCWELAGRCLHVSGWHLRNRFNQMTHSTVMIKNPNAPYMSIIGWGTGSVWKYYQPLTRISIARLHFGVVTPPVQVRTAHVSQVSRKRSIYKSVLKT